VARFLFQCTWRFVANLTRSTNKICWEGKDTTLSGAIRSILMQTTAANVPDEASLLWFARVFLSIDYVVRRVVGR
jgi:hypothetical protein